jgi:hypothetical protein
MAGARLQRVPLHIRPVPILNAAAVDNLLSECEFSIRTSRRLEGGAASVGMCAGRRGDGGT